MCTYLIPRFKWQGEVFRDDREIVDRKKMPSLGQKRPESDQ